MKIILCVCVIVYLFIFTIRFPLHESGAHLCHIDQWIPNDNYIVALSLCLFLLDSCEKFRKDYKSGDLESGFEVG